MSSRLHPALRSYYHDLALQEPTGPSKQSLQPVHQGREVAQAILRAQTDEPQKRHVARLEVVEDGHGLRDYFNCCSCGFVSRPQISWLTAEGQTCEVLIAELGRRSHARSYGYQVAARLGR